MFSKEKSTLPYEENAASQNSNPAPAYAEASSASQPAFQTRFASLSLHSSDKLRFLRFPSGAVAACRQTVASTWRRGIQASRPYAGSQELKLSGRPWDGSGDQAIEARRLVCALLRTLHTMGWVLTLNTDVDKNVTDKDTLIFRHQVPAPAECEWGCIAFSKQDRLRFIDLPAEVSRLAYARIDRSWSKELGSHMPGVPEIKFHGTPWRASGTSTMKSREIMLILLDVLEEEGWTVYASIDQKNGTDSQSETDTWHCCRTKGWEKGLPVFHS